MPLPVCWMVMQTLLASTPDKNRRSLEYSDGKNLWEIARMNSEMNEWTAEQQADLKEVVRLLEKLKAMPSPFITRARE